MKSYTDLEQSKKLAEILPLETADMCYGINDDTLTFNNLPWLIPYHKYTAKEFYIPCWSLSALLEELNRNCWKISLKCCGAEWDITYDDGERYISVPADYAIDACYEMILKLHEQKLL